MRVLIIESNPTAAKRLGEALRRQPCFETIIASGVETGLDHIGRESIDCVILPTSLPDWKDAATNISDTWPDLPILLIGSVSSLDRDRIESKGSAPLFVVPRNAPTADLVAAVREAVAKGELGRVTKLLARGVFVGRGAEIAVLRESVDKCLSGHGGCCVVEGDAGVGKTSLARQIESYAAARDVRVLWGRCHPHEGAPPYWMWMQVLRAAIESAPVEDVRADLGAGAAVICELLPELAERIGSSVSASDAVAERSSFQLFTDVCSFLIRSARRRPTLIVLDDVHWADPSSLLLLDMLARDLANSRMMVLSIHCDLELRNNPAAAATIARLQHQTKVRLQGLSQTEVKEVVGLISAQKVPESFARALYEHTDGNPFFIAGILQLLVREKVLFHDGARWTARANPEQMRMPSEACEILSRRLAQVSERCRSVLAVGSLVGRQFSLETLAHLTGDPIEDVCALVDEAITAGLVSRVGGPVRDCAFAQAMVTDFLYNELPMLTRADLHRRLGLYLEQKYAGDLDRYAGSLAHHLLRTRDPESQERAQTYALRAAEYASRLLAHAEAARYYEIALRALAPGVEAEGQRRLEILLRASDCWWKAGATEQARKTAGEAADIARASGEPATFARAALAYAGQLQGFGAVVCEPVVVALLDEALDRLGEGASDLHALLKGRLAEELTFSADERRRCQALGSEAVVMARASGDPRVLASVLKNLHWALWKPEEAERRLELADEVIGLAAAARDAAMEFDGHLFRCLAMIELADAAAAQEELAVCRRLAQQLRQPYNSWLVASASVCLAFVRGRVDDIEFLAQEARRLGEDAQSPNAALFHDVQLSHLSWLRGDFEEIFRIAERLATYPLVRNGLETGLAVIFREQELRDETRIQFEALAVDDFARMPRDVTWVMGLTFLAEACAYLGDAERAAKLYDLLQPFAAQIVVLVPVVAYGPASHYLGLLAATKGNTDLAAHHYEEALAICTRTGMAQARARTLAAYAELLLDEEPERARALLKECIGICGSLGLNVLHERADAFLERCDRATELAAAHKVDPLMNGAASAPARPDQADMAEGITARVIYFQRHGAVHRLDRNGDVSYLKAVRGFEYIRCLIERKNQWIDILDLEEMANPGVQLVLYSSKGEMLDMGAIKDFRKRIKFLKGEMEDAHANNEFRREAAARELQDQIREELKKTMGLNGKSHDFTNPLDRLRQRIQKAITTAKDMIRLVDPKLAEHLDTNVKTGYFCCYVEDALSPIIWKL